MYFHETYDDDSMDLEEHRSLIEELEDADRVTRWRKPWVSGGTFLRHVGRHSDNDQKDLSGGSKKNKDQPKKPIPSGLRYDVLERDRHCCLSCGARPPAAVLHVDHITPASRGGETKLGNLQTLCSDCNLGKGDRYKTDLRR